jgi:hypothetical protein
MSLYSRQNPGLVPVARNAPFDGLRLAHRPKTSARCLLLRAKKNGMAGGCHPVDPE